MKVSTARDLAVLVLSLSFALCVWLLYLTMDRQRALERRQNELQVYVEKTYEPVRKIGWLFTDNDP